MGKKVKWGVLSTAKIGIEKVIPGMQAAAGMSIAAIASRDPDRARKTAEGLSIPKHYGSYEELLGDKEIDVIYNPLPNHLHVPWTIKCLEAGKHVSSEKPLAMELPRARELVELAEKVVERAMPHPELDVVPQSGALVEQPLKVLPREPQDGHGGAAPHGGPASASPEQGRFAELISRLYS